MLHTGAALHTAARRHALEMHEKWAAEYQHTGAIDRPSSAEARNLFPRYLAHSAILECVERLDPLDVPPLPLGRELLASLAMQAENDSTRHLTGEIERRAIEEERGAFAEYLHALEERQLASTEPLPYRRVLADDKHRAVWSRLAAHWSIERWYWFPLAETTRTDVSAFQAPYFERDGMHAVVRDALAGRGVQRVWELREHGPSYEVGLEGFEPVYDGAEAFWCSAELDWLVYASHESSVTVGGDWLLRVVRDAWHSSDQYQWTSWSF